MAIDIQANKKQLERIFADFARECNVAFTNLDQNNPVTMVVDEDIHINFLYLKAVGAVICYTPVAFLKPVKNKEILLEKIAKSQFLWLETKGFMFSYEDSSDRLFLLDKRRSDFFVSTEMLGEYIDQLVDVVKYWRTLIGPQQESDQSAIPLPGINTQPSFDWIRA